VTRSFAAVVAIALLARATVSRAQPAEPSPEPAPDHGDDIVRPIGGPDSGDDVVRPIGGPDTPVSPTPTPAPSVDPDHFQLTGWARQLVNAPVVHTGGVHDPLPDAYAVPYDQLISKTQALMRARYSHAGRFEASMSGAFTYSVLEQNPASRREAFEWYNGRATRGHYEASLRELYFGFYSPYLDVRLGQQRVAWGNTDVNSPNDIVNAYDLRDPLLDDREIVHVPTALVRADLKAGATTLELVIAPWFTPDRYDIYGSNWALVQPDAPRPLRGLLGALTHGPMAPLAATVVDAFSGTGLPAQDGTRPSAGARLGSKLGDADVDLYYHYGFETTPYLQLDPMVAQLLAQTDFNAVPAAAVAGMVLGTGNGVPISVSYYRRQHVGADLAAPVGPFVVRLDAGWSSNGVFLQRDLIGFRSSSLAAVAAVEYDGDSPDKVVIVEASYQRIADVPVIPLLFYEPDSFGVAVVGRWMFGQHAVVDVRAITGIHPASYAIRMEGGWRAGALTMKLGGLIMRGDDYSLGSYFRQNASIYLLARYAY
jgi:hypothetical protein